MSALEIVPVTPAVGAEIRGVDLREPLDSASVRAIERALLDHLVLFFRDQDVTPEQQKDFARQFGSISVPPFAPKYGDDPEIVVLDQTYQECRQDARCNNCPYRRFFTGHDFSTAAPEPRGEDDPMVEDLARVA